MLELVVEFKTTRGVGVTINPSIHAAAQLPDAHDTLYYKFTIPSMNKSMVYSFDSTL